MALKGTIMWDTRPTQADLSEYEGGGWGPACLQAHQAPPRLCPALAFDTIALMLPSMAAFVLSLLNVSRRERFGALDMA